MILVPLYKKEIKVLIWDFEFSLRVQENQRLYYTEQYPDAHQALRCAQRIRAIKKTLKRLRQSLK